MIPWETPRASRATQGHLVIPGSKSATARALVLAALASDTGRIFGALDARDTRLMRAALESLGTRFEAEADGSLVVTPSNVWRAGRTIECGLSGTVMRFVPPIAAMADGTTRFVADAEAASRPIRPLLDALTDLGAPSSGDATGFSVDGGASFQGGPATLDASLSSQFVSGLLLSGARFPRGVTVRHQGPALPSRPHIDMTAAMLRDRGVRIEQPDENTWAVAPGTINPVTETVEPDLTTAATFLAAALITGGRLSTAWPVHTLQAGSALLDVLAAFGGTVEREPNRVVVQGGRLRGASVDLSRISELTCVAAALAAVADGPTTIRGVAHIRGHETDRLAALTDEINGLGGQVRQTGDGLIIEPTALHGGIFHTYADHRLAHAGALLGLVVPGIVLDDVACTTKTLADFPGLWQGMLAG